MQIQLEQLKPSLTPTAAQCVTPERLFLRCMVVFFFFVICLDLLDENVSIWYDGSRQPGGSRRIFQECRNWAEYVRGNFADVCPCQKCSPEKGKLCFPTLTLL